MTIANGHERRVIEAIHESRDRQWTIRAEDLAVTARRSPATFHRQFKSVTSVTPLQYQKQLRLLEARRLTIASSANIDVPPRSRWDTKAPRSSAANTPACSGNLLAAMLQP
jgi:transcriptional regulator GlxA family with amidase domain